jgi:hypothetical protein
MNNNNENLNKLSEESLDEVLRNRDKRSTLRKVIDDKIIPVGGAAIGGLAAVAKALGNIKVVKRTTNVD